MRRGCTWATMAIWAATATAQEPARNALPEKAALARAEALVREVFAADLRLANSAESRLKLAGTLVAQARENKDDAANRYVLLGEAMRLAAAAGDPHFGLTLLDELTREFDVDPLERKAAFLAEVAQAKLAPDAARSLFELSLPLLRDAVEADQFDVAKRFAAVAETAAQGTGDPSLGKLVAQRRQEMIAVEEGLARLQGAVARIKADPKDAAANLELGKYYSLLKGRWDKALPLLAMGSDADLRDLARRDVAGPKIPAEQLLLADAWWDRAETEKDPGRLALQTRAAHWYEQALPSLQGLSRTKAARRLERVAAAKVGTADAPSGPVGELRKFEGHKDEVKAVAISADGRYLLSGSLDQTARLWDANTGAEERTFRGHTKQLWNVAFHPNGRSAITSSWDATVRLWDTRTGDEQKRFTHRLDINGVALSRAGDLLLAGSDDHNAYLWNLATGEEVRRIQGHTGFVYAVAFSPDGKHAATGGVDKSVRIVDLATGALVRTLEGHQQPVTVIAFSPDGRHLFSCGDAQPRQWEVATGNLVRKFERHGGFALAMTLTPDGRRLITGGDDRTIRIHDVATGKELHRLTGHDGTVASLAVSADGRRLVSGSPDRTVRLWGLPSR